MVSDLLDLAVTYIDCGATLKVVDNHTHHEVAPEDKSVVRAVVKANMKPGAKGWEMLPCDILHSTGTRCPEPHPPVIHDEV